MTSFGSLRAEEEFHDDVKYAKRVLWNTNLNHKYLCKKIQVYRNQ